MSDSTAGCGNAVRIASAKSKETKFTEKGVEVKASAFDLETHVTVDGKQDTDSKLKAVAVKAGEEAKPRAK
jgi:hypothetical protein